LLLTLVTSICVCRYELKDGIYTFGYYDCDRIVQGGAIDDYQYHYFCSNQVCC